MGLTGRWAGVLVLQAGFLAFAAESKTSLNLTAPIGRCSSQDYSGMARGVPTRTDCEPQLYTENWHDARMDASPVGRDNDGRCDQWFYGLRVVARH